MNRNSNSASTVRLIDDMAGNAFIELLLVLPALLIIIMSGIEGSLAMKTQQVSTSISRELVLAAQRLCVLDSGPEETTYFDTQRCFEEKVTPLFRDQLAKAAPDATFVLTLYVVDGTTVESRAQVDHRATAAGNHSKFAPDALQNELTSTPRGEALDLFGSLLVAEVFIPQSGPLSASLFNRFFVSTIYGVTIA
ncbi:MAG: hypothetical protein KDD69_10955 [Bdellovibrionales bacterium]|nr:hypothetical protein [Bdellovibrionales bacterium]